MSSEKQSDKKADQSFTTYANSYLKSTKEKLTAKIRQGKIQIEEGTKYVKKQEISSLTNSSVE